MTEFERSLEEAFAEAERPPVPEERDWQAEWERYEAWLDKGLRKRQPRLPPPSFRYQRSSLGWAITIDLLRLEDQYVEDYEQRQRHWFNQSLGRAINDVDDQTGIDVNAWEKDVRSYVYKLFSGRLRWGDVEIEDAIQEVLMGLEIRNQGICPWHPGGGRPKYSYVYMVTECVVRNMVRKRRYHTRTFVQTLRAPAMLPVGVANGGRDEMVPLDWWTEEDTHKILVENTPAPTAIDMVLVEDLGRACAHQPAAEDYVEAMIMGHTRRSLYSTWPQNKVDRARKAVLDYFEP